MLLFENKFLSQKVWFFFKLRWKLPRKMFDLCAVAINNTHIFIAGKASFTLFSSWIFHLWLQSPGGSMYGKPQVEAADILDTTTNTWHSLPDMPLARSAPGCILTEVNGEAGIMVTGGLNSEQLEQTKRTEFLSLSTHTWSQVWNMYIMILWEKKSSGFCSETSHNFFFLHLIF